ncbi:MAG: hypothetical protein WDM76_18765 [Limisphaerales bacterium]
MSVSVFAIPAARATKRFVRRPATPAGWLDSSIPRCDGQEIGLRNFSVTSASCVCGFGNSVFRFILDPSVFIIKGRVKHSPTNDCIFESFKLVINSEIPFHVFVSFDFMRSKKLIEHLVTESTSDQHSEIAIQQNHRAPKEAL